MNTAARQRAPLLGWMDCLADRPGCGSCALLEREELGVAELCEVVALPQSTVSRHLKALSGGRLGGLPPRRDAASLYRLAPRMPTAGGPQLWALARAERAAGRCRGQDRCGWRPCSRGSDGAAAFFAGAGRGWDALRAEVYGRALRAPRRCWPCSRRRGRWPTWAAAPARSPPRSRRACAGWSASTGRPPCSAARRRIERLGNVELHRGRARGAAARRRASCDAALLVLVLAYLADPGPVLAEAARMLRPGGRLVVVGRRPPRRRGAAPPDGPGPPGVRARRAAPPCAARPASSAPTVRSLPPEPGARGPGLVVCDRGRAESRPAPAATQHGTEEPCPHRPRRRRPRAQGRPDPCRSTTGSRTSSWPTGAARRSSWPRRRCPA